MTKPIGFDNWLAFSFIFNSSERDFTAIGSFLVNESTSYKLYRGPNIISTSADAECVITTAEPHGFFTGQSVRIYGLLSPLGGLNIIHVVTVLSTTTFSIPVDTTSEGTSGNVGAIAGIDAGLAVTSTGVTAIPGKNCMEAHATAVEAVTLAGTAAIDAATLARTAAIAELGEAWDRAWIG